MNKLCLSIIIATILLLPLASAYGVTFYNPTMNPQDGKLFEMVEEGKLYDIDIDKDGLELRRISFKVDKESKTAGITAYHLVAVPPVLPELEHPYETLEFRYGGFATHNINYLGFDFRVSKEWLTEESVPRDTVVMHWHNEGRDVWVPITTKITGEDDYYVYYKSSMDNGARFFSIGQSVSGEKAAVPAEPKAEPKEEPKAPEPVVVSEPEVVVEPEPAPVAVQPAPVEPKPAPAQTLTPVTEPATTEPETDSKGKLNYLFYVFLVVLVILIIYYIVTRVPVKPSVDKEIDRYIKESKRHGKSRTQIKDRLLEVGWHHERVEKALGKHKFQAHHEVSKTSVKKPNKKNSTKTSKKK